MVKYILPNKQTTVQVQLASSIDIITKYQWKIDGVIQPDNTSTLILPPYQLNESHIVSCTLTKDCGSTSSKEETFIISESVPIIRNGNFANVLDGWLFETGVGNILVSSGQAVISITTLGAVNRLYQTGIVLKPNTNYRLRFDLSASTSKINPVDIELYIHDTLYIPQTYPLGLIYYSDVIGTLILSTYEYIFNTIVPNPNYNTVPPDITLRFKFMNTGQYTIDNVVIEEYCPTPIVTIAVSG